MVDKDKVTSLLSYYEKDQHNVSLVVELLQAFGSAGRAPEGLEFCATLAPSLQAHTAIRWERALLHLMAGDITAALTLFKEIPAHDHEQQPYFVALCLFYLNQTDEAYSVLQALLAQLGQTANKPPLHVVLLCVRVEYFLGKLDSALDRGRQALSQYAHQTGELHGLMAVIALDSANYRDADSFATHALTLSPSNHDALLTRATLHLHDHRYPKALEIAQTAAHHHPNSGRIHSILGQAMMSLNQFKNAYREMQVATQLMDNHIGSWHVRAWLEILRDDISAAEQSFTQALALNRNFAESHGGLALVAALRGQPDQAESAIKIALRLDPDCLTARYAQSRLALAAGHTAEADSIVQAILSQPSNIQGATYQSLIRALSN